MSRRPRFDKIYSGPWPYDSHMGVGMRFDGLPNDRTKFIEYMMDYSCAPQAGQRIYDRIKAVGYDLLTVMDGLPFDEIAEGLKQFGVVMSIIPPLEGWTAKFKHLDSFPEDFIPPPSRGIKDK